MYCYDITDMLSKVMFNIHVNLIYSGTNYFLIGWRKGTVFFLEKYVVSSLIKQVFLMIQCPYSFPYMPFNTFEIKILVDSETKNNFCTNKKSCSPFPTPDKETVLMATVDNKRITRVNMLST